MVPGVFIALPGFRLWHTDLPFAEAPRRFRPEQEREHAEPDVRCGKSTAKLQQGLMYRRLADAQVFLPRDPEVDTQNAGDGEDWCCSRSEATRSGATRRASRCQSPPGRIGRTNAPAAAGLTKYRVAM